MYYPGDIRPILFSLDADVVTTAPQLTILNAATDEAVDLSGTASAAMSLVAGTSSLYKYLWNTLGLEAGTYIALASYVADGKTVTNRFVEALQLGDSRITAEVAKDATVAKEATSAKDATVMKKTDFVAPSGDASVQGILTKVTELPSQLASQASLDALATVAADLHDEALGGWELDRARKTLTLKRKNGAVFQVFNLTNTDTAAGRTRA